MNMRFRLRTGRLLAPPHEVRDHEKLRSMIAHLRAGGSLPRVRVIRDATADDDGVAVDLAIEGSHRIAAWNAVGIPLEDQIVEVDEDHLDRAFEIMEDVEGDFIEVLDLCDALAATAGGLSVPCIKKRP